MSSQGAALNVPIIQLQLRFTHNRETEEISPADCIISTQGRRRAVNVAKKPSDVADDGSMVGRPFWRWLNIDLVFGCSLYLPVFKRLGQFWRVFCLHGPLYGTGSYLHSVSWKHHH